MADYWKKRMDELDEKLKKEAQKKKTVTAPSASTVKRTVTGPSKLRDEREIAPVMKTFEPKKTTVTAPERKSTAIAKAILGTAGDLGMNAASGAVGHIEGITDAVGYGAADIADKIGKGSLADRIREKTKESFTQKLFGDAIKTYGEHSLSGDFTDSVAQGIGQVGTSILGGALSGSLLGGLGIGKRAVEKAVSAITTGATAMSGFGSGVGQAYEGRATDEEAKKYGMIAGASEALTELLFGGMGKVSKALGHSKGLLSLDDMLAKKVSNIFSNQIVKNIAEFGVKSSAEGFEEVLAGMAQAVGKKITYMKDEDLKKILKDEKLLEQYLVGMTTSAIMQSGDLTKAIADKTDFITGLNQKEQAVVDKEVENRIAERERDGKKLSKRDKDKIYDEVKKALDEGGIDTDVIESVLGGETYKKYKDTADNEAALKKEFDTLNKMKQGDMTGEQTDRRAELKEKLEEIKNSSKASQLKSQLSNEVSNLVKDSRLAESYNEKARRKETFKADLAKYDTKQQEVIKKAVESGILNNTRRTHGFVDFIAKISADKGVSFDFTSNEKLKESGFAIEGRTVNGLVTKDGIQINVNSAKALNTVVGHEVMHIFEGTELYPEIQRIVKEVAVKKGEYQSRYDEITELYEDIEDADIEKELTADLVGDYLFSDEDFIRRLSTENRSLFDKLRDEIKYLCKVATAGSAEARKLEQAKKLFEKVYREEEAKINTADEGGVRYSITQPFTDSDGNNYENAVLLDTEFFDGMSPRNWGSKLKDLVYNRSKNNPIILPITDEKGNTQQLQFAKPNERVVKNEKSNHKVIDKLSSGSDNISKLAVVHIDEIVEISEENNPYYTNEHNHQWLDANGWLHRNANVINTKNGNIYNLTVDIAKTADGRTVLYATNGKIKKVGNVHLNSLKIRGSGQNSNYEDSIPDFTENVKQKDVFGFKINENADVDEDLLEELSIYHPDAEVDSEGNVTVYHRTSKANAEKIRKTGIMTALEDALFFSSKSEGYASDYGDTVLTFKIPSTVLRVNDIFSGEVHFDVPLKRINNQWSMNVSKYLVNTADSFSLSSKDTAPKKYGDYAVYGEDVMLEGEVKSKGKAEITAPTAKKEITAPMRADVNNKFPMLDDVPIRKDLNSLKSEERETEHILGESQLRTAEPKKNNLRAAWKSFLRNFVSKGAEVETYALKGKNRAVEDKYKMWKDRSEAKAQYFMENGDSTGKSLKDIYDTVTQSGLEKEFDLYMKHRLNVDRMKYEKPVFSYDISSEMSAAQVKKLETNHPEFIEWAKDVYAYNQNLLQMMVEKGLLLQETADMWAKQYPNYIPIERLVDKAYKMTGKKIGISAPIKEATGGNNVMETLLKTMAHRTVQVFKAIDKNDFGIALKNSTYNNTLVEEEIKEDSMDDLSFLKDENTVKIDEGGKGAMFTVYENGKKVTFNISNEMYEALQPTRESLMLTIAPLNKTSAWHKKVLTEYNLFFTARNFPKDAQEVLINSQHPVSTYKNMPQALKEIISGEGDYITEYYKNGGRSNTYFDRSANKFEVEKSKFKKAIGFVPSAISKINDVVEAVPRVAEYIASRKKGATIEAAMLDAARVTTDFSDGGDVAKFLNRNGATFLNASVQGAAQQVRNIRQAKAEGFKGIMKLVAKYAVSGLPVLLFNAIFWDDDEEYEGLSEYIKDSYYVIAKYGDGQFVRIPKGRTAAVIQKAVNEIYELMTSDGVEREDILEAGKEIGSAIISNIAPNNPIDNNILAPAIQAYTGTSWYGEDIVPARLQDVPAKEQYDESIDTISKWLGENTGISPYKINYLLNQYSGFVGDIVLPAFTPEAENGNKSFIGNITAPMKDQFTADSVLKNNAPSDFSTLLDKLKVNSNSKKATDEDKLKYKYVSAVSSELSELYKMKREIQNSNLSDDTKFRQVREIQRQVNETAKKATETYENVNVDGKYATVNDLHYRLDDEGKWQKITDEQLEKQKKVIGILGITPSQYWSNKQEYDMKAFYPEKYAVLQKEGISVKDYKEKHEESAFIYTDDYSWAAQNPESYALSKTVTDNVAEYRKYTSKLYEIRADKDSKGNSISGSAKRKKKAYIWSLDIDEGAKYILFRNEYKSDDTYNGAIINYLLSRNDISYEDKKTILTELDFKIDSKGRITWN